MSQKLDTSPAVIGIDIGKNSLHIIGQLGIVLSLSRPRVSLDYNILSFNITKPAQFLEKCAEPGASCVSQFGHRGRRVNNGNAVELAWLLRVRAGHRSGEH